MATPVRLVIRGVPAHWHRAFQVGAAMAGQTAAEFLVNLMKDRKELHRIARKGIDTHGASAIKEKP